MESRFASQESLWRSINENPPELKGVTKESRNPVATTNFSEVYRGSWLPPDRGVFGTRMLVAIKVIRTIPGASAARQEQTLRQLKREITLQERLKHENILPFLGVSMDFGDLPSPISEWMANGTVLQYLKKNPQASRLDFLKGIARGMRFLHQPTPHKPSIVHGDLKGSNILVTNWGAPCLADFGLSRVYDPATFWNTATESVNGTTRWMSPELLSASNDRKSLTIASDIYAYGITAWEIVTGKLPYHDLIDTKVILEVTKGLRPTRPRDISDALWNVMQQCWDVDVKVRPSMGSVLRAFHKIAEMNPPLRLLSLDSCGIRIITSLQILQKIMEEIGANERPCDHFDMIAGSGTGGLVALMLGRLRMSIEDCLSILPRLFSTIYSTPVEKQRERASKDKMRFNYLELQEQFKKIVQEAASDGSRENKEMADNGPNTCRTFVIANNSKSTSVPVRLRTYPSRDGRPWPYRIWAAMAATMALPTCFDPYVHGVFSMEAFNNFIINRVNPCEELVDEARATFGLNRPLGCVISCGTALSSSIFVKDLDLAAHLPPSLSSVLQSTSIAVRAVHQKAGRLCDPGSYFRFDPSKIIMTRDPGWKEGAIWERPDKITLLRQLTAEYMQGHQGILRVQGCARRLAPNRDMDETESLEDARSGN